MKNMTTLDNPMALHPSKVQVANIPANPVPELISPIILLGNPFMKPRNTASPKLYDIPWKILAPRATQKKN